MQANLALFPSALVSCWCILVYDRWDFDHVWIIMDIVLWRLVQFSPWFDAGSRRKTPSGWTSLTWLIFELNLCFGALGELSFCNWIIICVHLTSFLNFLSTSTCSVRISCIITSKKYSWNLRCHCEVLPWPHISCRGGEVQRCFCRQWTCPAGGAQGGSSQVWGRHWVSRDNTLTTLL